MAKRSTERAYTYTTADQLRKGDTITHLHNDWKVSRITEYDPGRYMVQFTTAGKGTFLRAEDRVRVLVPRPSLNTATA